MASEQDKTTVAIVGSRHWMDYAAFARTVRELLPSPLFCVERIVSGGATGVDWMAHRFSDAHEKEFIEYPVRRNDFRTFTEAAHARNQQIAADLHAHNGVLIALPGPKSKGTYDTIRRCRALGVPVIVREVPE